jgi:hypothetical protein
MTGAEQLSKAILESGDVWLGWPFEVVQVLIDHLRFRNYPSES